MPRSHSPFRSPRTAVATALAAAAAAVATIAGGAEIAEPPQPAAARAAVAGFVRPAPTASPAQFRAEITELKQRAPEPQPEPEPAPAPAPAPVPAPQPATPSGSVWDRLAMCESSGNWASSIGTYEGGLQFHPQTWDGYKPAGYPEAAYEASRDQQILVAERVLARQGWGAWPACSRKLGLR